MMAQPHLKSFAFFAALFSDCFPEVGARTTTCIVVIPEKSQIGLLHSDRVLLFSNIFPALISLRSFTVLGPFSLSLGHWAMMVSLSVATVDAGGKRLGPMSVPSGSRNLISNCSWTADISGDGAPEPPEPRC